MDSRGMCVSRSPAPPPPTFTPESPQLSRGRPSVLSPPEPGPFALAARHSPVTRSAPAFRALTLSPQGPRLPSRLPLERGCVPEHNPVPAGPAHPEAGGASSSSQSASRAPRPARMRRRLWAKAPHSASQEEARVERRVSGPCTVSVSIRPPTDQAGSGSSLYSSLIFARPRKVKGNFRLGRGQT